MPYPVTFDVPRPEKFERPQVVIRILVLILISIVGSVTGWLWGLVYLALPVAAAIFLSQKGGERFLAEDGPRISRWITWLLALYAYIMLLTDRFPTERPEDIVRFQVQPGGSPSTGSALLRLIYSIPSAFVLALLSIVGAVIWLIAVVYVLIKENYPQGLYDFQLGIIRWHARLFAYHGSLVQEYPPFSLETGHEAAPAV